MKKSLFFALCAFTVLFAACTNTKSRPTPKNPLFAEWVLTATSDSLQLVAGGIIYEVRNFELLTDERFTLELHDDSTVYAIQGYTEGSEDNKLIFDGLAVGKNLSVEDGYYYLSITSGAVTIGQAYCHPILFRKKP